MNSIRPTCCGEFPVSVCADCPCATDEQRAAGGVASKFTRADGQINGQLRCDVCFMRLTAHSPGSFECPAAERAPAAPPEEAVVPKPAAPVVPPRPRVSYCPSCSKEWNGARVPRAIEGMSCGTCGQQSSYS